MILSHHQYFSSFDDWYQIPAKQTASVHRAESAGSVVLGA
jgi:hypothetical protein